MSLSGPARVLILVDQPLLVETIKLTLNHAAFITSDAATASEGSDSRRDVATASRRHRHGHRRRGGSSTAWRKRARRVVSERRCSLLLAG